MNILVLGIHVEKIPIFLMTLIHNLQFYISVSDPGFFSLIRIRFLFWVRIRIGQKSGSDPENSGSGSVKRPKTGVNVEKMLYLISSTLNTILFGQAPPKPYQNHYLDPINLFMDGSGSGLIKLGSGSAKKPGSIRIRIRNADFIRQIKKQAHIFSKS